jgi:hypothetical protein
MPPTFEDLKAKVADWLSASSVRLPDSVCGDLINQTQRAEMRDNDYRFGEIAGTFSTVAGTYRYTLPELFSRPIELWFFTGSDAPSRLNQIPTYDQFIGRYPDPTNAALFQDPQDFLIFGNEIWLGPTPGSVITINHAYYQVFADLTNGSPNNENQFTKRAWEVLFWGALVRSTEYTFEDARRAIYEDNFERVKRQLAIEHSRAEYSAGAIISQEPG